MNCYFDKNIHNVRSLLKAVFLLVSDADEQCSVSNRLHPAEQRNQHTAARNGKLHASILYNGIYVDFVLLQAVA